MTIGGLSKLAFSEVSVENAWQTPEWLVDRVHALFGGIDLDPCTVSSNPVKANRIYTADDDGILMPWDSDRIYVNPPYGKTISHWVTKVLFAAHEGRRVVLLAPSRTDSRWFHEAWGGASEVLFIRGRLSFRGAPSSAPFPSVLFGYNIEMAPLGDLGIVVKP